MSRKVPVPDSEPTSRVRYATSADRMLARTDATDPPQWLTAESLRRPVIPRAPAAPSIGWKYGPQSVPKAEPAAATEQAPADDGPRNEAEPGRDGEFGRPVPRLASWQLVLWALLGVGAGTALSLL